MNDYTYRHKYTRNTVTIQASDNEDATRMMFFLFGKREEEWTLDIVEVCG